MIAKDFGPDEHIDMLVHDKLSAIRCSQDARPIEAEICRRLAARRSDWISELHAAETRTTPATPAKP